MTVHLVNPSHLSFGVGVITPRWLFVLAGATPTLYDQPRITDETLEPFDTQSVQPGDVVGIGIHTGNALRGYEIGSLARNRGATVIFGGIHATLYPGEAQTLGGAHAVVKGDGDVVWPLVLNDAAQGNLKPIYEAGRVDSESFVAARWELLPHGRYMWGSVQTGRGCPKHCSFCSVWRTDGQKPRQRRVDAVVDEIVEPRRRGFRFIALADDNFYPVTLADLAMAERQRNAARLEQLRALRAERFALMDRLAQLRSDMVFFTQITMEAAEDTAFLDAMRRANIKGALVGVEAVTPESLKDVYKRFNDVGEALIARLRTFRESARPWFLHLRTPKRSRVHVPGDRRRRESGGARLRAVRHVDPVSGYRGFRGLGEASRARCRAGRWSTDQRHWLIPQDQRPKVCAPHPVMSAEGIRARTQAVWDEFYSLRADLGALAMHADAAGTIGLRADFEALPADVRQHGDRDRQRTRESREPLGAPDRQAVSAPVCRAPVTCAHENGLRCVTSLFRWRLVADGEGVMLFEFIDLNRDVIVSRTRDRVRSRPWPSVAPGEVEHGVPLFLTQLSETLRLEATSAPFPPDAIGTAAARHGGDLVRLGFTVSQVVHDYGDICQTITALAVEQRAPISVEEFHTLNRCLDTAIAEAVTEHARVTAEARSAEETERLGHAAHELRDSLNTAILAFHTLKRGLVAINGGTGAVLGRSVMNLREVIDCTLSEVHLEVGQQRRTRLPVAAFIDEVAATGMLHSEYRRIQFTIEPIDPALSIDADAQLLTSAVMNLLHNAFKNTPSGGHVVLRARAEDGRLLIETEDECGGIPQSKRDLFQVFGDRRGSDRSGLGLGLSIARKAVRAHGGEIRIRNLPGKGCVFSIEVPLAAAESVRQAVV